MRQFILFILGVIVLGICGCNERTYPSGTGAHYSWPQFRGDASFSGYTKISLPDNPVLVWSYKSEAPTHSSPIVYNSVAYWCDKQGNIRGVDIEGNLSFDYQLGTPVGATPMIYDSVLYIGRKDGIMTALSLSPKNIRWNFETEGPILASPNFIDFEDQAAVIFGSYDSLFYCVNRESGAEIKRFKTDDRLQGGAAVWNDHLVFGGIDSRLRIIDARSGMPTDSFLLGNSIITAPAVRGEYCYIGDHAGNIYKFHMEKGKIQRHMRLVESKSEEGGISSVPAVSSELFIAYWDRKYVYAISRKDGSKPWKYKLKGEAGPSSPVICGDKVIFCTEEGLITILNADNGKVLWEYETGEQVIGSPAIIKGHFYILTAKGTLLCFGASA